MESSQALNLPSPASHHGHGSLEGFTRFIKLHNAYIITGRKVITIAGQVPIILVAASAKDFNTPSVYQYHFIVRELVDILDIQERIFLIAIGGHGILDVVVTERSFGFYHM